MLDCDDTRLKLRQSVVFHPKREVPPQPQRKVLDAVARLLFEHSEIQLVRVEVYPTRGVGRNARRAALEAQQRADAILRDLWRRGGVSAERLEAVGYGNPPPPGAAGADHWAVLLRVVQRRPARPSPPGDGGSGER